MILKTRRGEEAACGTGRGAAEDGVPQWGGAGLLLEDPMGWPSCPRPDSPGTRLPLAVASSVARKGPRDSALGAQSPPPGPPRFPPFPSKSLWIPWVSGCVGFCQPSQALPA